MGSLSSWAGLAVTHHWIVQYAAFLVTNSYTWNEQYEILADDLVIFNKEIADKYLEIMTGIGCEINLHKSIVSHNKPVFEFAKRTCLNDHIVSGISFAQVKSGWNISGRVNNILQWSNSGLITKNSVLALTLCKYTAMKGKVSPLVLFNEKTTKAVEAKFSLAVLSLFGTLHNKGRFSLKDVMQAIIDPRSRGSTWSDQAIGLPLSASLHAIHNAFVDTARPFNSLRFSNYKNRSKRFDNLQATIYLLIHQKAVDMANDLLREYKDYIRLYSSKLVYPIYNSSGVPIQDFSDLPDDLVWAYKELYTWAEAILGLIPSIGHPLFVRNALVTYRVNNPFEYLPDESDLRAGEYYDELVDLLDWTQSFKFKLSPSKQDKTPEVISESPPIIKLVKDLRVEDPKLNVFNPDAGIYNSKLLGMYNLINDLDKSTPT